MKETVSLPTEFIWDVSRVDADGRNDLARSCKRWANRQKVGLTWGFQDNNTRFRLQILGPCDARFIKRARRVVGDQVFMVKAFSSLFRCAASGSANIAANDQQKSA